MVKPSVKHEAQQLIDHLPEDATWDDIEYEIYVRRAIESGLADSNSNRESSVRDVRKSFGLPE
jgi:hypothetical protein